MKNLLILVGSSLVLAACTPKGKVDPNDNTLANITVTLIENGQASIISTSNPEKTQAARSCPAGTTQRSASSISSVANLDALDVYIFDGNYPVSFSITSSDKGGGIGRMEANLLSDDPSGTAITNLTPASVELTYRAPQNISDPNKSGGHYGINQPHDPANLKVSDSISFDFNPTPQNRFIWLNVSAYDLNGNYANRQLILGRQTDFCE